MWRTTLHRVVSVIHPRKYEHWRSRYVAYSNQLSMHVLEQRAMTSTCYPFVWASTPVDAALLHLSHQYWTQIQTELLSFQNCSQSSCQRMMEHYFALLKLIAWATDQSWLRYSNGISVYHSSLMSWTSPSQLFRQLSNFLWFCRANYIILAHRIPLGLTSESSDLR